MLALVLLVRVGAIPLSQGIADAERIVLGRVSDIRSEFGIRVATVRVERTFKGISTPTVRFMADPTWTCDVSNAKLGERAIFLLDPRRRLQGTMEKPLAFEAVTSQADPPYPLNFCGSGRLIFERNGLAAHGYNDPEVRYHHYSLTPPFRGRDYGEAFRTQEVPIPERRLVSFLEETLKHQAARPNAPVPKPSDAAHLVLL